MEKPSVIKLQEAGYSFLRVDEKWNVDNQPKKYVIKFSNEFGIWKNLKECKTKAETRRELDRLLNDENLKYLH